MKDETPSGTEAVVGYFVVKFRIKLDQRTQTQQRELP